MIREQISKMTDEQLDRECYRVFARKDLSFGCITNKGILIYASELKSLPTGTSRTYSVLTTNRGKVDSFVNYWHCSLMPENHELHITEILGHPVMLGDVLETILCWRIDGKQFDYNKTEQAILAARKFYSRPLETESRECKEYILGLTIDD